MGYFQERAVEDDKIAANIAEHLETRQHLGTALVLCDSPFAVMCVTRKKWLKLARNLQNDRAGTLNSDKILRFTHAIMHMQQMEFTIQSPTKKSDAKVFFAHPQEEFSVPPNCMTLYVTSEVLDEKMAAIVAQLAENSLCVDYTGSLRRSNLGLQPKEVLEARVADEWAAVTQFLKGQDIAITDLVTGNANTLTTMLDTLLAASNTFLPIAKRFQQALLLAKPLELSSHEERQYLLLLNLAYRVQTLTPRHLTELQLAQLFAEDDTFFLRDAVNEENESSPTVIFA